jgi:hypothetical protein
MSLIAGGAAQASSVETSQVNARLAIAAKEADQRGYLIVNPGSARIEGDKTFYPTGPIADDTLVVIADASGQLPNGLTEAALDAHVAERRANTGGGKSSIGSEAAAEPYAALATWYAWGATSSGYSQGYYGGSWIGTTSTATVSYYFWLNRGFNSRASGQGQGYYRGYSGSTWGTWAAWYYVGNTGTTGAGAAVPWGNIAANRYFRAICTQTTACGGYFE